MFHLACAGWVFFRAKGLGEAFQVFGNIFGYFAWDLRAANMLTALVLLCAPLWAVQALQGATGDLEAARKLSPVPRTALWLAMALMFVWLANTGGGAFIYFQF